MIRRIIRIDEKKCNGCGACANACHESAIGMVNRKAKLLRDDYCDGFGDCLPACPTGAISFEEREAAAYNEEAVKKNQQKKAAAKSVHHGCPGAMSVVLNKNKTNPQQKISKTKPQSRLSQWPVQIKLAPINAPYFSGASLLIAADCTAYAYANFHADFINRRTAPSILASANAMLTRAITSRGSFIPTRFA